MAVESSFLGQAAGCLPSRPYYDNAPYVACSSTEKNQSYEAPEIGIDCFEWQGKPDGPPLSCSIAAIINDSKEFATSD